MESWAPPCCSSPRATLSVGRAPYLVLLACALFAAQPILAKRLAGRDGRQRRLFGQAGTFFACVYGAYFGAGLGVLCLRSSGSRYLTGSSARVDCGACSPSGSTRSPRSCSASPRARRVEVRRGSRRDQSRRRLHGARFARRVPAGPLRVLIILIGLAAAVRLLVG